MNIKKIILIAMITLFGSTTVIAANVDPDDFPIIKQPLSIHGVHISGIAVPNQSNVILPTPSQCEAQFGIACYTPPEIRKAYDVPDYLSGAGQTIVLVEAFGSPTILNDIKVFDQQFGLPDPHIQIFYPEGQPVFDNTDPNQLGWAGETTLDVSWAHAIAPGAKIDIVVGKDNMVSTFTNSEQYVFAHHLGNIMSMSFGNPESFFIYFTPSGIHNRFLEQQNQTFKNMSMAGMTLFAASGDNGDYDYLINGPGFSFFYPIGVPNQPQGSIPADNPYITAVGGTDLFASDDGTYQSETVWNDTDPATCAFGPCTFAGVTGGAPSLIYASPSYQTGVNGQTARTTSDVSYNAGEFYFIYISYDPTSIGWIGGVGTSFGSPQWAGIAALINQALGRPIGFLNPKLYSILNNANDYASAFHDITVGNNTAFFGQFGPPFIDGPGFSAKVGYDLPTGLGTPDVANLINVLVKDNAPQ